MFVVGLEVDLSLDPRARAGRATTVSLASIALPFGLGVAARLRAVRRARRRRRRTVSPLAFALFLGVAMSITAFPVLARILTERGMHRTAARRARAGLRRRRRRRRLVAARGGGGGRRRRHRGRRGHDRRPHGRVRRGDGPRRAAAAAAAGRPVPAAGRLTPDVLAVVLVGLLLSACATEWIGIHAIFGAFVFGAVMPRGAGAHPRGAGAARAGQRAAPAAGVLRRRRAQVDLSAGSGASGLVELLLILLVAIGGKFLGALRRRPAVSGCRTGRPVALGVLMNTRGLTEIVILQVGAAAGRARHRSCSR